MRKLIANYKCIKVLVNTINNKPNISLQTVLSKISPFATVRVNMIFFQPIGQLIFRIFLIFGPELDLEIEIFSSC